MNVLIGCEESGTVRREFHKRGHFAVSCDILPSSEPWHGFNPWHYQGDIRELLARRARDFYSRLNTVEWDLGIFHPECTYLTCSAEWAYKEGPYHQKLKPGTLAGKARIKARAEAYEFFMELWNCGIPKIAIENPVGVMSRLFRKPDQTIQPYQFGENASKRTCLWLKNLPLLTHTEFVSPRYVDGKPRWDNQTDSGQNKLSPSDDRSSERSKTYTGIAVAMAEQWGAQS